jgi:polyisoprenoid-binding protein YceI
MGKYLFVQLWLPLVFGTAFSQYIPDNVLSSVKFHVRNFGIRTDGVFRSLDGRVTFDVKRPQEAKFDMSVNAAGIDTGNELRDSHLRGDGYFDVNRFPVISFVSRQVTAGEAAGTFRMTGELSIKGHSKTISFPFMYTMKNGKIGFTGSFTINRKDFDIGGSSVISDSVGVDLNVVLKNDDKKISQ